MHVVHKADHGTPVAKLRVHPKKPFFVSFSLTKDEILFWSFESNKLTLIARAGTGNPCRVPCIWNFNGKEEVRGSTFFGTDVAFHPHDDVVAVSGEGKPIELYNLLDGTFVRSMCNSGGPVEFVHKYENFSSYEYHVSVPVRHQGFRSLSFSHDGRYVFASSICDSDRGFESHDKMIDYLTAEVFEMPFQSNTCYASHAASGITAAVANTQTQSFINIFRLAGAAGSPDGPAVPGVELLPVGDRLEPPAVEGIAAGDRLGWSPNVIHTQGMMFNSSGNSFALVCGLASFYTAPYILELYSFPSIILIKRFEIQCRPKVGISTLSCFLILPTERVAFWEDDCGVLVPYGRGSMKLVNIKNKKRIFTVKCHDDAVTTVEAQWSSRTVISGGLDSRICVWKV